MKPTCTDRRLRWLLASLATVTTFAIVLAGCSPPTTQPPSSCLETADHGCISGAEFESRRDAIAREHLADPEYQEQKALERVNAHQAHASLEVVHGSGTKPGEGVTIGIIDSGVDLNHPELAGAQLEEFLLQGVPDEIRNDPRDFSHGTAVTSVIAAQPNDKGFIGLAWGADFKVFAAPLSGPDPNSYPGGYDPRTYDWSAAYRTVLASGVAIVNASYYAVGRFVENYTAAQTRAVLPQLKVVAQEGVAEPTIFVWAAGNDHGDPCSPQSDENCVADPGDPSKGHYDATSPNVLGGAVALLEELQGHNVVVAALAEDGSIADYSNRCGVAADWCIAAPGSGIIGAYFGPLGTGVARGLGGTSYATPLVTGGLALMKQLFRNQLSHRELVTRLFWTADKGGLYTDSATYGQGALDLGAAVSPVGTPRVTTGNRIDNPGQSIQTTRLRLGSALGDGFSRSAAGLELAAFDELGAPFWFELPTLTDLASTPSALEQLRELMAPPVTNSLLDLAGATTLARVASGLELSFTDPGQRPTPGLGRPEPGMGALLSWQPRPFGQDRTLRVGQGQPLTAARIGWLGGGGDTARLQGRWRLRPALGRHPDRRLRTPVPSGRLGPRCRSRTRLDSGGTGRGDHQRPLGTGQLYLLPPRHSATDRHRSTDPLPLATPPAGTGSGDPEPACRSYPGG